MIRVDPRSGSGEFLEPLIKRTGGRAQHYALMSGDFAWEGAGPDGRPVPVGVERKTVNDALQCIKDGRFSGSQLPQLQKDYEIIYLLIEGRFSRAPSGKMMAVTGVRWQETGWWYSSFVGWWHTMMVKAGLRLLFTATKDETVDLVAALYQWWQEPWTLHAAHRDLNRSQDPGGLIEQVNEAPAIVRFYAGIPGIGNKRAWQLEEVFPTPDLLLKASEEELQKTLGKKNGANLYRWLRGIIV